MRGRPKAWWKATLFSYGPKFVRGKVDGFHIVARSDDGTDKGRYVDVALDDAGAKNLRGSLDRYLARDRGDDHTEEKVGDGGA